MVNNRAVSSMIRLTVWTETFVSFAIYVSDTVSLIFALISFFIFRASYEIFKESINILLDSAVIDEEQIKNVVNSFTEVKDIHKIRSRGSHNDMYVDMHIMIEANTSLEQSHALSHALFHIPIKCQVIIHMEPYHKKENTL